jgi:Putative heavy-metal chelation
MNRSKCKGIVRISRMRRSGGSPSGRSQQPIDTLNPSAFSIEAAEKWALERAQELPPEPFRLTAYYHIDYIVQMAPQERKTRYITRMAKSEANDGLAFGLAPLALPNLDPDFIGKDVRQILKDRLCRHRIDRTALVDLVMGHLSPSATKYVTFEGTVQDKYFNRARIFAEEAEKIIQRKGVKENVARALVIGATAGIIGALSNRGFEVSTTDLSPRIVGTVLGGLKVCDGRLANASLMKQADIAIMTGMTLPNRTLPGLIKLAQQYNTSTMIWAITGKNFGRYYTEHGIDCVISDPMAFHLLPGSVSIGIWRREF